MKSVYRLAALSAGLLLMAAGAAIAQTPRPPVSAMGDRTEGRNLYNQRCASCHDGPVDRAPAKADLASRGPDDVIHALSEGVMRPMAAGLTSDQIEQVAVYLTGKLPLPAAAPAPDPNPCPKADPIRVSAGSWNGWGLDLSNSRYQANPGLSAANVARLKVKWTFAYAGSKNTPVTVVGDRLFLGGTAGKIYSLNAKSGCVYWRYDGKGGARAAPVVGRLSSAPSGYAVYINDDRLNVNALDAVSGKLLWSTKVETHPRAMLTGSPTLYNGVLYTPVSSGEEISTREADYVCCSFRGNVVALDAKTGKVLWKTYTIEEAPHPYRVAEGKHLTGPAGGAVWSATTIDPKRGLVYVASGDSYTDVDTDGADAIIAIDMKTGKTAWRNQVTQHDNFLVGCPRTGVIPPNCPSPVGPDVDFGSAPILQTLPGGKQIILAGQKSGMVYGMDPDDRGKTLWKVKLGRGGPAGGVEWGMAADGKQLYVAIADPGGAGGSPGLNALALSDGHPVWRTPTPQLPCPAGRRCPVAQSAPVSAIPGVAFSGAEDGHLRAYSTKDGSIIWDFDTTAETYDTANGVKGAKGGMIDATGPTIAGGMVFQHSGYGGVMAGPSGQNLLMAFSVDGK